MAEAQKGVFDHLAEYLLQPTSAGPAPAPETPPTGSDPQPAEPAPAAVQATDAAAEGRETFDGEEPATPTVSGIEHVGQTLVFVETTEKLVVEKELFVREEVVLRKRVDNRVEEIEDSVRRTEVEVQRLSPEEAERIAAPPTIAPAPPPSEAARGTSAPAAPVEGFAEAPKAPLPAPKAQPAKPIAAAAKKQPPAAGRNSASWWLWFALILMAAVLIAFTAGQFLGAASG
jgi:hypothetical protein